MNERICRSCGRNESEVRFYARDSVAGRAAGSCCQPCWVAKSVAWRHANRDKWNRRRHYKKLQHQFGITEEEYEQLYADPRCAGCGREENGRRLALDHDHVTNKVRGLLCHDCNRTIATAHDNPAILRSLALYVERF